MKKMCVLGDGAWGRHERVLKEATKFMDRIPPVAEKPYLYDNAIELRGVYWLMYLDN